MICFCACFHISLIWERNKIRNVISILSRIFVASKQFKSFFHLFHSFSFTETQITPQFRRAISYGPDLWICFFYTLVLHFIWTSYSAALHSTFATSIRTLVSITATAFHIIFVRLTCPKAHMMRLHNFHSLDGGLARVTCDLECSQRRTSSCVKPDKLGCHSAAQPSRITRFPYPWTKF